MLIQISKPAASSKPANRALPWKVGAAGLSYAIALISLVLPVEVFPNTLVTQTPIVDAPAGTVGLGFGIRFGDSPYVGVDDLSSVNNDNQRDLLPLYLYEGQYFFAHGTSAGFHLYRNDTFAVDIVAQYRFDRLQAEVSDFYAGMEDRRQTVDAGITAGIKQGWGSLSATVVTDTLDRHGGEEIDLTYRYDFHHHRWTVSPYLSRVYQSSELTDYYYGVDPDEVAAGRPEYQVGSVTFWRAGLNTSYELTPRWRLYLNLGYEDVPDVITDSPLVEESSLVQGMLGASYFFGNLRDARDVTEARKGEWSWRINGGYTAEETFHKVHRGYFQRSQDVHTYLAGFTFGKLLQDGPKVDYWGRFSINRRLENGLQDNFTEYVAYVMAMGTGYSPWSSRELFRYGFGFGFSYAQSVPMVEQIKQAERERNTSHFLNYLEAQVDTPTSNIFGDYGSDNCYVGLTLVHRSGIFATADLLGNVGGGSDVLTLHLECKQ